MSDGPGSFTPVWVNSVDGTHFTGAIAAGAQENESLSLTGATTVLSGNFAPSQRKFLVDSVTIHFLDAADGTVDFNLYFYHNTSFYNADPDTDAMIGMITLPVSGAVLIAANHYMYADHDIGLICMDSEAQATSDGPNLHVGLGVDSDSATGKAASPTDDITIRFGLLPL